MYVGAPILCLGVKDLDRSTAFYQALGMEVSNEVPGKRANLRRGGFKLCLMTLREKDVLNFRGVDAFAIHSCLQERGLELVGRLERYTEEEDNENGTAPPLLVSVPELQAAVSAGTGAILHPFDGVQRSIGGFDATQESNMGEIPAIHGRYGTSHFSDIFGYGSQSCDSY